MSHFLSAANRRQDRATTGTRLGIRVRYSGADQSARLTIDLNEAGECLTFVPKGTQVARVPDHIRVLSLEGAEIPKVRNFYVTIETLDPIHVLFDLEAP